MRMMTNVTRGLLRAAVLLFVAASVAVAQAGTSALNVDEHAVILKGYDAVAYQADGQAVQGSPAITATHEGATYYFASASHRDLFVANPARYAPAFGGFCAMGVAVGKKLDGDPKAFTVLDGTLYLNVNEKVCGMWAKDIAGHNRKADKKWTDVRARKSFDSM